MKANRLEEQASLTTQERHDLRSKLYTYIYTSLAAARKMPKFQIQKEEIVGSFSDTIPEQ